jgi:hypothetical protein
MNFAHLLRFMTFDHTRGHAKIIFTFLAPKPMAKRGPLDHKILGVYAMSHKIAIYSHSPQGHSKGGMEVALHGLKPGKQLAGGHRQEEGRVRCPPGHASPAGCGCGRRPEEVYEWVQ